MKTIKSPLIILFVILSSTAIISSCSEENNSKSSKTSKYLNTFYKSSKFTFGKSVQSKSFRNNSTLNKGVELENVIITEVFVGDETIARGYLVTDKENNDLLYFIDVDRIELKLTSVDIIADEQKVFDNIDMLDKYLSTDKLDYIKIAEEIKDNPNYFTDAETERRFWGWQQWTDCDEATGMGTVMETYYVFGVGVKTRKKLGLSGGTMIEPCGGGALLD